MVTHVMHLAGFHAPDPPRSAHWDTLEKALTVFVLPRASTRRRLDLICAQPAAYWCAVVGWCVCACVRACVLRALTRVRRSGSVMFQRDLRQWAKDARCGGCFVCGDAGADCAVCAGG